MSQIGYLIDADGFIVNNKFVVKEMAIGDMKTSQIILYSHKVGNYHDLSPKDKEQALWLTTHLHGLPFASYKNEFPQEDVYTHLLEICIAAEKDEKLIGYKGGHYELDMLTTLGYEHLAYNIENMSCPKVEVLFVRYPEALQQQCKNHFPIKNNKLTIAHCPKMEVYCFMRFVVDLKDSKHE